MALVEGMKKELDELRQRVKEPRTSVGTPPVNETDGKAQHVDFFAYYSTLSMKSSSHEDHKPLCAMSLHKKDHYASFFMCYLILALRMLESGSDNLHVASKWAKLLDLKDDDHESKDALVTIIGDRRLAEKSTNDPLVSRDLEFIVKKAVLDILPPDVVIEEYLGFFFKFLWPSRAFVDEKTTRCDIRRLIDHDSDSKRILNCSTKNDMAILGLLLVILRYVYITVWLMDKGTLDPQCKVILEHPVPVTAVATAYRCISSYNVLKQCTLPVLQTLLFIRCYYRDAPEDGDGPTLFKSQNLCALIVQYALQMGMNRDPINYLQTVDDIHDANMRRRIWHYVVAMDAYSVAMAGTISMIPDECFVNVNFPLVHSMDLLEHSQRDILIRTVQINTLYFKISKVVNEVRGRSNLNELTALLKESRQYVDSAFSMDTAHPIDILERGSMAYAATAAVNARCLSFQLIQSCLELQISFSLSMHFASNAHLDLMEYKRHYCDVGAHMAKVYDLSCAYLCGDLSDKVSQEYNFEMFPLLNSAFHRTLSIAISGALRLYQAKEIIKSDANWSKGGLTVDVIDALLIRMLSQCDMMLTLMKEKLATRYCSALKIVAVFKYALAVLRTHEFNAMIKIMQFLESGDEEVFQDKVPMSKASRKKIKRGFLEDYSWVTKQNEWMEVSQYKGNSKSTQIVSINQTNMYLEMTRDELEAGWSIMCSYKYSSKLKEFASVESFHSDLNHFECPAQNDLRDMIINGRADLDTFAELESFIMDDNLFDQMLRSFDMFD